MTYRNAKLLQLAKGAPCLAAIPGICNSNSETVVAAHSNDLAHGKEKRVVRPVCASCPCASRCRRDQECKRRLIPAWLLQKGRPSVR